MARNFDGTVNCHRCVHLEKLKVWVDLNVNLLGDDEALQVVAERPRVLLHLG